MLLVSIILNNSYNAGLLFDSTVISSGESNQSLIGAAPFLVKVITTCLKVS